MKKDREKPYYGYRINTYIGGALIGIGIVGIALGFVFAALAYPLWVLILCWALGAILLIWGIFWQLSMAWVSNAEKVGPFHDSFLNVLGTIWDGEGKVLDIGTGRGRMVVEIAKRFPEAQVVGVDIWPKFWGLWGQTKEGAEKNAMIANVSDRCSFQNGNALNLRFRDGGFQLVVSSFCFHEINVPDRTALLKEVVRVLAPGGTFVVCDLFRGSFLKKYQVKNVPELLKKIEQLGVEEVEHKSLKEAGINLGRLYHIWGIAYLSGRKIERKFKNEDFNNLHFNASRQY